MRASDVITKVTKQNMNVMVSTVIVLKTCEALERQKQKVSAIQNNLVTKMFLTY